MANSDATKKAKNKESPPD
ncbi:hypothetical protein CGLO_07503 [Colletotrichum gloeosporioides Cg-14]|uniref:Uncharacterized protein n=1 Tax=Colletotrichum gloeosporioides (strain Cg-14) TaxID=1237896 RepID=T0LMB1_COLGC|nr:hypothetical protein CGLO_07503 [Colletotrichum gloeosporioides Cg-14]